MKRKSFKYSKVLIFACALLSLVSCSSNDAESVKRERVCLSAVHDSKSNTSITRTTLSEAKDGSGNDVLNDVWSKGDKVYVYNMTAPVDYHENLIADNSAKNSTFTGYVTCGLGDELTLFYPDQTSAENITGFYDYLDDVLTLNISQQNGSLSRIAERYDFCYASANVTGFSGFQAVAEYGEMKNIMAVCRFDFVCNGTNLTNITSVKVTDKENLYIQRSFDLSEGMILENEDVDIIPSQGITFTFPDGASYFYEVFFPGPVSLEFSIVADGKNYVGHLTGELKAGNFYATSVYCMANSLVGSIPVVSDRVGQLWASGNLYYSDGKFGVYKNQYEYMVSSAMKNGSAAIGATGYFTSTDLFCFGDVGTTLADGTLGFYNYNVPIATYYLDDKYDTGTYYHTATSGLTTAQDMGIAGDKKYDICTRALGASWRLPSYYEMQRTFNYRGMGYYYNQYFFSTPENKPNGSDTEGLFLPPAGYRYETTYAGNSSTANISGGISQKGNAVANYGAATSNPASAGYYLTGSIYDASYSWVLRFWWNSSCDYPALHRANGFSVRCRYIAD